MGKKVTAYRVRNLSKIDVTRYKDGDIFLTNRTIGILNNGKIEPLNKNNGLTKKQVKQMIQEVVKEND